MRRVSIALQGNKSHAEYAALARLVEDLGFDMLSVYADLGFQPAIGPLIAAAEATSRIALGPAALNPYLIHPVEIANQMAYLDRLSGGRAYLGLVRGAWLESLGIKDTQPIKRIREAIAVVHHLLSGNEAPYQGDLYQLPAGKLFNFPIERPSIPMLIGSWGPKLIQLAGEIADEVKIGGSTNPALVASVRAHLAIGEARSGRRIGSTRIAFGAVTVVDEDGPAARAQVRREAALYIPVVAPLDPTVSLDPAMLSRMAELVASGEVEQAGNLVPDDLLDRFAFSGSPDQIAAQAQALFDAGVDRVEFGTPHGFSDARGIRLLGERLLPQLTRDA
jgi:5,10-methylenetetrahydromethanopterin reductase